MIIFSFITLASTQAAAFDVKINGARNLILTKQSSEVTEVKLIDDYGDLISRRILTDDVTKLPLPYHLTGSLNVCSETKCIKLNIPNSFGGGRNN